MKRLTITFLALLLLVISSCKEKPKELPPEAKPTPPPFRVVFTGVTDTDRIKNMILRYNELLAWGYANLNMSYLEEVVTKTLAEDAYIHMAAIGEGTVRMISQLQRINFKEITSPGKDKTVVKTEEHWDYAYTDIETGKKKEEAKDFVYLVTYTVEKSEGRWIITEITASAPENPGEKKSGKSGPGNQKNIDR